jgi:hypothetical protein
MSRAYRAYAPRPLLPLPMATRRGFTLRRWWIDLQGAAAPDAADWAPAEALAEAALPALREAGCPGVGFLILHRGRGADYLVLGWWARENELPLRVFVRTPGTPDAAWRTARGDESVCVWDLEVIARERAIYLSSYLAGLAPEAARAAWIAAA